MHRTKLQTESDTSVINYRLVSFRKGKTKLFSLEFNSSSYDDLGCMARLGRGTY